MYRLSGVSSRNPVTNVLISLADPINRDQAANTHQHSKKANTRQNQYIFGSTEITDRSFLSDIFNVAIDSFAQ